MKKFMLFIIVAFLLLSIAGVQADETPAQQTESINVNLPGCALTAVGLVPGVGTVVNTGFQIINLLESQKPAEDIFNMAIGIAAGPFAPLIPIISGARLDKALEKKAKNEVFNIMIREVGKTNPLLATGIDACTNAREKLIQTKDAEINVDEKKKTLTVNLEGTTNEDGDISKALGKKEGDVIVPKNTTPNCKDGLCIFKFKEGAKSAKFGNFILSSVPKDATFEHDEKTGLAKLDKGSLAIGDAAITGEGITFNEKTNEFSLKKGSMRFKNEPYSNLADADFRLSDNEIVYAKFDVAEKCRYKTGDKEILASCAYAFTYKGEDIIMTADKGGHVLFDPAGKKRIEGTFAVLSYKKQEAHGDFRIELDDKGDIIKVTLLKKDSSYRIGNYEVFMPTDKQVAIYFNGEDVKEENGISFSKDKLRIALKGQAGLQEWTKIKDKSGKEIDAVKFRAEGKAGTLAEIIKDKEKGIDSVVMKNGELNLMAGIVPGLPAGKAFRLKSGGYAELGDNGMITWGSVVKGIKKESRRYYSDLELISDIGVENYVQLQKDLYAAGGNLAKIKALQEKYPEVFKKYYPEYAEAVKKTERENEFSKNFNKVKTDLEKGKISGDNALMTLADMTEKYPEFKNDISLEMADIYAKKGDVQAAAFFRKSVYKKMIPELEKYVSQNPKDMDARFRLAALYNGIDDAENAKKYLNEILKNSDRTISLALNPENIRAARLNRAAALTSLGQYESSLGEYQALLSEAERAKDTKTMEVARLNMGLLRAKGGRPEEAIGDFGALEKISTGDMQIFASRMKKALKLDAYEKFANSKDKASAIAAQKMLSTINPEELKEDLDAIENDLKSYGKGKAPKIVENNFKSYKELLSKVAAQPEYAGLLQPEIERVLQKEEELQAAELKKEINYDKRLAQINEKYTYSGKVIGGREAEYSKEKEKLDKELLAKDNALPNFEVKKKLIQEDLSKDFSREYKESLKSQLVGIDIAASQRKALLTGEKDVNMITKDIFDIQTQLGDLEKTTPFLTKTLGKIPLIGAMTDYGKKTTQLTGELEQKYDQWEYDFEGEVAHEANPALRKYNPRTGNYEDILDTVNGQEKRAYSYGIQKVVEAGITIASAGVARAASGAILKVGESVAGRYITTEAGIKFVTGFAGIASKAANPALFHTANNLFTIAEVGAETGDLKTALNAADWSPGAFANTYVTLGTLGAAGKATSSVLAETGLYTSALGKNLAIPIKLGTETASFTALQVADNYARGGASKNGNFLEYTLGAAQENALFVGALQLGHLPSTFKEIRFSTETTSRVEKAQLGLLSLQKEAMNIRADYEQGAITSDAAQQKLMENIRASQGVQEQLVNDYKTVEELWKSKAISRADYDLSSKAVDALDSVVKYNAAELETRKAFENKLASPDDMITVSRQLFDARESRLETNSEYLKELEKQSEMRNIDVEFITELKTGLEAEKQKLSESKVQLEAYEAAAKAVEDLNNQGPPTSILTVAKKTFGIPLSFAEIYQEARWNYDTSKLDKALPSFEKVIEATPETAPEHQHALALAASAYEKQGKTSEAVKKFEDFVEKYPEGRLSEAATMKLAELYETQEKFPEAASSWQRLADLKVVSSEAANEKGIEQARSFLEKIATREAVRVNFEALGIPEEEIKQAMENPAERADILVRNGKNPMLVMGGMAVPAAPEEREWKALKWISQADFGKLKETNPEMAAFLAKEPTAGVYETTSGSYWLVKEAHQNKDGSISWDEVRKTLTHEETHRIFDKMMSYSEKEIIKKALENDLDFENFRKLFKAEFKIEKDIKDFEEEMRSKEKSEESIKESVKNYEITEMLALLNEHKQHPFSEANKIVLIDQLDAVVNRLPDDVLEKINNAGITAIKSAEVAQSATKQQIGAEGARAFVSVNIKDLIPPELKDKGNEIVEALANYRIGADEAAARAQLEALGISPELQTKMIERLRMGGIPAEAVPEEITMAIDIASVDVNPALREEFTGALKSIAERESEENAIRYADAFGALFRDVEQKAQSKDLLDAIKVMSLAELDEFQANVMAETYILMRETGKLKLEDRQVNTIILLNKVKELSPEETGKIEEQLGKLGDAEIGILAKTDDPEYAKRLQEILGMTPEPEVPLTAFVEAEFKQQPPTPEEMENIMWSTLAETASIAAANPALPVSEVLKLPEVSENWQEERGYFDAETFKPALEEIRANPSAVALLIVDNGLEKEIADIQKSLPGIETAEERAEYGALLDEKIGKIISGRRAVKEMMEGMEKSKRIAEDIERIVEAEKASPSISKLRVVISKDIFSDIGSRISSCHGFSCVGPSSKSDEPDVYRIKVTPSKEAGAPVVLGEMSVDVKAEENVLLVHPAKTSPVFNYMETHIYNNLLYKGILNFFEQYPELNIKTIEFDVRTEDKGAQEFISTVLRDTAIMNTDFSGIKVLGKEVPQELIKAIIISNKEKTGEFDIKKIDEELEKKEAIGSAHSQLKEIHDKIGSIETEIQLKKEGRLRALVLDPILEVTKRKTGVKRTVEVIGPSLEEPLTPEKTPKVEEITDKYRSGKISKEEYLSELRKEVGNIKDSRLFIAAEAADISDMVKEAKNEEIKKEIAEKKGAEEVIRRKEQLLGKSFSPERRAELYKEISKILEEQEKGQITPLAVKLSIEDAVRTAIRRAGR
jgi:tetratricopeptide (TPR) repeat protein